MANGTPVLSAASVIDNEFFAVLWGDEFIYSDPPRLAQMMEVYEKYGGAVISGVRIPNKADLKRYGIADVETVEGNVFKIKKIVKNPILIKHHPISQHMVRTSCLQIFLVFYALKSRGQAERFIFPKQLTHLSRQAILFTLAKLRMLIIMIQEISWNT